MDAGVAARSGTGYLALDKGNAMDIWIKRSDGSGPLTAGVWCGNAYFPDFYKPEATDYWKYMLAHLKEDLKLDFDGIWLDENEATNFCNGYCDVSERPQDSLRNKPYYVPGWRDLEDKALGVDGLHANGYHEYDLHNLFALKQVQATSEYLVDNLNKRPYVLSRSNFPGITKYGHTWIGDNWSTVEYMKLSVDGLYSYALFGLPFMGCDICGFNGDATPEICTKWHQLGSLYPFARNHNQNATSPQEPYIWNKTVVAGAPTTYTDLIRTALRNRYSVIRYYYSSFWNIGDYGGSFFKPLFFEFPNNPAAYLDI
jgi:alpha-glucosidase (family GH31 glycosyl hydrolase)